MQPKRFAARYEKETTAFLFLILIFTGLPLVLFGISMMAESGNMSFTLQMWGWLCLFIIPAFLLLDAFYALYHSETVAFKEDALVRYRTVFSKKGTEIAYSDITQCVASNGLWYHQGSYRRGRKVYLFSRSVLVKKLDLNSKLVLELYTRLGEKKFKVIGDNRHTKTIDKFFNIVFSELSYEQQLVLTKRYCHLTKSEEQDGEELLRQKKAL
ncbi:MAG: hypothetical protein K2G44_02700 [Clostridia bacterium]|nr:hypothetical protein [Clostridia bacterium]